MKTTTKYHTRKRNFTEGWKQKISETRKKRIAEGKIKPWNKGLTGEEYAEHYTNGFPGICNTGKEPWNKNLTGEEYAKHYPDGFNGGAYKGHIPWNTGITGEKFKKHYPDGFGGGAIPGRLKGYKKTEEHREKLSITRKKLYQEGKIIPPNLGKTLPKEHRLKISKTRKQRYKEGKIKPLAGEQNPQWQGGFYPYYGHNWYSQRKKALKRDKYICQNCGKKANIIHHKTPLREYLHTILDTYNIKLPPLHTKLVPYEMLIPKMIFEETNNLNNLITCCEKCHKKLEPKKNKKRGDETLNIF